MKNATATSHGRSRLLEVDGPDGIGGKLEELAELVAMKWNNYCTNELKNFLDFAGQTQITPFIAFERVTDLSHWPSP
jgi:hypothetical protein